MSQVRRAQNGLGSGVTISLQDAYTGTFRGRTLVVLFYTVEVWLSFHKAKSVPDFDSTWSRPLNFCVERRRRRSMNLITINSIALKIVERLTNAECESLPTFPIQSGRKATELCPWNGASDNRGSPQRRSELPNDSGSKSQEDQFARQKVITSRHLRRRWFMN